MISDASNKNETFDQQVKNVDHSAKILIDIIEQGHDIIITHGNGPQVGSFLLQQQFDGVGAIALPLKILNAVTQGQIGVMLQHALINELKNRELEKDVFVIPTSVIVDKDDKGFTTPTKPIGPFYSSEDYEKLQTDSRVYKQLDKGWRRVVASPRPIDVLEGDLIDSLSKAGNLVISVGGGGSPTIQTHGSLALVDAVIDKDLASSVLASKISADMLLILTNVEGVYEHYGTENQVVIGELNPESATSLMDATDLGKGSMEPKLRACVEFVANGGSKAGITTPEFALQCINNHRGTRIRN